MSTKVTGVLEPSKTQPIPEPDAYQLPKTGFLSFLPEKVVPYAELMRLDRPAGYFTFYFPHLYGTLYAALRLSSPPSLAQLIRLNLLFVVGSVFLRGAACTWNDIIDAPYDREVARCRHRAIARGAVTPIAGFAFTLFQTILGLALLARLPPLCGLYAFPLALLMAIYPFAKRFTDYPQIVLGFSLALGQQVGAAAVGIDPLADRNPRAFYAMVSLYTSNVLCAIIVDAVYSHQDLQDDMKLGLKSIATGWQDLTKPLLWLLALSQVLVLAAVGVLLDLGWRYLSPTVMGTAFVLGTMIWEVKLDEPASCGWWFRNSIYLTGLTQASGLFMTYLARRPAGFN